MTLTVTRTRTHTEGSFANPFLACDACGQRVVAWHDPGRCGCDRGGWENHPCGHQAGSTSGCPSWGPVDGCQCERILGHVPHPAVLP